MTLDDTTSSIESFRKLPKVDLHRHLEGSLRFETVREVARAHGLDLPPTQQLRSMVQVQENEPFTFENFLSKFTTLRMLYRSPEIISRVTQEAIEDAAKDNVRYLELRFTPVALSKAQGFPLARVIDWVIQSASQAEKTYGVTTRLIVSVNRHEGVPLAAQVAYLAQERASDGIVGLDLAGYEPGYPPKPFASIFCAAQENGLHITVHAGEWDSGDNIAGAIETLGAERIGHGIRVLESPGAVDLALQRKIAFEVCPTSNYQSGAVTDLSLHPFKEMLRQGLNVTLNTDDPSISQITLSHEYRLACNELGLSQETLKERILAAARAAFLPEEERARLVSSLEGELGSFPSATE
jgi:adenosine deaminase